MIYFTICARNYLAYAKTLRASLLAVEPQAKFWTVLIEDRRDQPEAVENVLYASELGIPSFWDMALRYSVMELATAIKPFVFLHFLESEEAGAAIYLDPDIQVFAPLAEVHALLRNGTPAVLTPHSTVPLDDGGDPDDLRLLRTGAYNLGFAAFSAAPAALDLLRWWAGQCETRCVVSVEDGLFVDQKFMDLAPCYLPGTAILHHPGYNVAYWNLPSRKLALAGDGWTVNGEPLIFFHFSGVVPGDPRVFSKHQDRYTAASVGPAAALLRGYLDHLQQHGHAAHAKLPYSYGVYDDGAPIPEFARRVYAECQPRPNRRLTRAKAFCADYSALNAAAPELARLGRTPVTRLAYAIWRNRADLQAAFPLQSPESATAFARWFIDGGPREHAISEGFVRPVRERLERSAGEGSDAAPGGPPQAALSERAARTVLRAALGMRPLYLHLPVAFRQRVRNLLLRWSYRPEQVEMDRRLALESGRAPQMDPGLPPGVCVAGYLQAESGVGEGARRAVTALERAGLPLSAIVLPGDDGFAEGQGGAYEAYVGAGPRRVLLCHVNADQTPRLPYMMDLDAHAGAYRIGYWVWELAEFPEAWARAAAYVDEIWTPSAFCRDAIARVVDKPVTVIPHPAPVPARRRARRRGAPFTFLTIFDFRSYLARKNPEGVVRAFRAAFPGGEDVRLVLKSHGGAQRPADWDRLTALVGDDERIQLLDQAMDRGEIEALQAAADCFVSLHRSEGFGLNVAECMALGLPVVATDYGATAEYLDETTGYPVAARLVELAAGDYPFAKGQTWADPDLDAAAAAMRAVVAQPAEAARRGGAAKARMRARFAVDTVGRLMSERLAAIEAEFAAPGAASAPPAGSDSPRALP